MQQIHVDTLAEWHQFSLDNAAFQSIPYKIILHRFAIILYLMLVLSSRTEHSKKYQKPCRSICNVPMSAAYRIRRNKMGTGEKKGKSVRTMILSFDILSKIILENYYYIGIALSVVNRGFGFQYRLNDKFFAQFFGCLLKNKEESVENIKIPQGRPRFSLIYILTFIPMEIVFYGERSAPYPY